MIRTEQEVVDYLRENGIILEQARVDSIVSEVEEYILGEQREYEIIRLVNENIEETKMYKK